MLILNIDEVIRIIREEDEPKQVMIAKFELTDTQAEAILNMRLRALRKLQEIEIRKEYEALELEQKSLEDLLAMPKLQWKRVKSDLKKIDKDFGQETSLGQRRTLISDPPQAVVIPIEAVIEKEDVTVICSAKGWIRLVKGHQVTPDDLKYKDGDEGQYVLPAQTTDKILVFASNGRFYTIGVDKLSRGRGHGEPVRLIIDLDVDDEILSMFIVSPEQSKQYVLASSDGRGFIVKTEDVLAQTKAGKQVMTCADGEKAQACFEASGDLIAVIGENRKLLIFKTSELPVMTRGRGVILQKYRQGRLCDIKVIQESVGLTWTRGGKTFCEKDLWTWLGRRGTLGRLAPIGFPRTNKFQG